MVYLVIVIHDIPQVLSANFFACPKQEQSSAVNTISLNILYPSADGRYKVKKNDPFIHLLVSLAHATGTHLLTQLD